MPKTDKQSDSCQIEEKRKRQSNRWETTGKQRYREDRKYKVNAPVLPVTGGLWILVQMFPCSPQALLSAEINK